MIPLVLIIVIHQLIITKLVMVILFSWDPIVPHSVEAVSKIIPLERTFCDPYNRNSPQIFCSAVAAHRVKHSVFTTMLLLSKN